MKSKVQRGWAVVAAVTTLAPSALLAADRSQTDRALDRSPDRVQVIKRSDGSTKIDLGGGFQHATVARVDEQGRVTTFCTEHGHQIEAFMQAPAEEPIVVKEDDR